GLEDVLAAEARRVVALLLRVLDRRHAAVVRQVPDQVPERHGHAAEDLGQVEPLPEGETVGNARADVDHAAHRSSSPAMTLSVPSAATASDTVPPTTMRSKAAMLGKQGGRPFKR